MANLCYRFAIGKFGANLLSMVIRKTVTHVPKSPFVTVVLNGLVSLAIRNSHSG
jgi:hypothetical protein